MQALRLFFASLLMLPLYGALAQEGDAQVPLTSIEECAVTVLTFTNIMMAGVSKASDQQMRRLAEQAGAQLKDEQFKQSLEDRCGGSGTDISKLSVERQDAVVELATCRYRDLLLAEYRRDGLDLPVEWARMPLDC